MTEETNTFTENNTPPAKEVNQTIGKLLREKREERGLTLKSISQQTKIHIGLLDFLENDELAKLPSKTYVRGFVKSASKILGINQEEALDVLEATYHREQKTIKKEIPSIEMKSETARNTLSAIASTPLETVKSVTASSTVFIAKIAIVIFLVGVVAFNLKNVFERQSDENLKLPQVLSTIHQKIKSVNKPTVIKTAEKVPNAQITKPIPMKVNLIQDKKDAVQKTELKINDVSLKNISLGEKQFSEDTSVTGEKLNEIFPPRYRVQVVKGVESLFINAVDGDSWITYKVDDKDIKKYVLRQGRSVFMRGEKIRLFVGNTKTLKIFYNNKLLKLNSKATVMNLVFPEELKTTFMSPLFVFQKDGTVVTSEDYIKMNQKQPVVAPAPKASITPAKKP